MTYKIPCTRRTAQGNDFELILTVKMESRHPVDGVEGYFGTVVSFGRSVIIAELWLHEVARRGNFVSIFWFKNDPLW